MGQSTILASGTTGATSTDVALTAGTHAVVGVFAAAGIPADVSLKVMQDTPGNDLQVGQLTAKSPTMHLVGPGTFRVVRKATPSISVGVFSEI